MKYDIILSGVGGQGVLSLAVIIAHAAMESGLEVRQSEVHGMSQRGGAVVAHLRISSSKIDSDLVPAGGADLILSMEPMESLRYLSYLKPEGKIVTAAEPFINIPNYPEIEGVKKAVKKIKGSVVTESAALAQEAGSARSANMVLIGAAAPYLPLQSESLKGAIRETFGKKGEKVVEVNLKAFDLGLKSHADGSN